MRKLNNGQDAQGDPRWTAAQIAAVAAGAVRGLIREMRNRGRTYREIAQVLAEHCRISAAPSTVHGFVHARSLDGNGRRGG
ncbi:MAG: hypothetical protein JO323_09885 [Acidobacteriia bacterium]|nr:hypothetical protein [Terriglobia bacterium]